MNPDALPGIRIFFNGDGKSLLSCDDLNALVVQEQ
jgi:hypothetical protein